MKDVGTASGSSALQAELNITPLIEVMLVLLVNLMVALPVMTHILPLQLPSGPPREAVDRPEPVRLSANANGRIALDGQSIEPKQLDDVLRTRARQSHQPPVHIDARDSAPYERVASLMSRGVRPG